LIALIALVAVASASAAEPVPDWFQFDAKRPYQIFEAWKQLSTREATICLGENWNVLAGRVVTAAGRPAANSPLLLDDRSSNHGLVELQTDARGQFIVYGPDSPELGLQEERRVFMRGQFVLAAPGFPTTQAGRFFAHQRKAMHHCQSKLLAREGDWQFYELTCPETPAFDAGEFAAFEPEFLSRPAEQPRPFHDRPRDPEGKPDGRIVRHFDLRVLDEAEQPVAKALVKYQAGCTQVRETDGEGRCRVEEWLAPAQAAGEERIHRVLTIDAPGYYAGPVAPDLKPDQVNVIRLAKPAVVTGKVVDHLDRPLACQLSVSYKRPGWLPFENRFNSRADGTFRFERVMPGEDFVVATDSFGFRSRQAAADSDAMRLEPGEVREGVHLKVPLNSGLRGIVVFEDGSTVDVGDRGRSLYLELATAKSPDAYAARRYYVGTNNGPWGPSDGRFGFSGLGSQPFHVRISAPGWEVLPAEPIQLEPGELRFLRVTFRRPPPKP
jgi:hypothetical protein